MAQVKCLQTISAWPLSALGISVLCHLVFSAGPLNIEAFKSATQPHASTSPAKVRCKGLMTVQRGSQRVQILVP